MGRNAGRAIAVALLGAVAGAAWLLVAYSANPDLHLEFAVTPPARVSGVYPAERDPASGLTFAWTGELMTIRLPELDRHRPWQLILRARGMRPDPATNPDISIAADGLHLLTTPAAPDFADVRVAIPPNQEQHGLLLAIRSSATMVPGPHDPRALGVMLDRVTLSTEDFVMPPPRALGAVALASAIAGAGIALLGASAASSLAGTALLACGLALLAARGFGIHTDYPEHLVGFSAAAWLGALTIAIVIRAVRRASFTNAAVFVLAFSAGATVLELGLLLHPDMPIGDALFHAHRFQHVLGGNWLFTSIAPGNYSFPYAPGLYVAALPFSDLVQRGPQDMALLRSLVSAADAVAGGLLYVAAIRNGLPPLTGGLAVVLYHAIPLEYRIATVGNLTNAFSQSLMVVALVWIAAPPVRGGAAFTLALAAVLAAAFMAHTSTFAIGTVGVFFVAAVFWRVARSGLRRDAAKIAGALALAVLAATLLYYAHFVATYRSEWARISAETAAAAPDAGGRSITARLASVPRYLHIYLGAPVLALAIWGFAARDRTTGERMILALTGWLLACGLFLAIGILTPVDMRHYLAAIPALALTAGLGASAGWQAGGVRRWVAVLLVAWALWTGARVWWTTF